MPHNKYGMNWIRLSTRMAIYARDRFDCVWCRCVFPLDEHGRGLSLDHVDGPSNAPENLVTACFDCNTERRDAPRAAWLRGHPVRQRRLRAALRKPIDRELGRQLAKARRLS